MRFSITERDGRTLNKLCVIQPMKRKNNSEGDTCLPVPLTELLLSRSAFRPSHVVDPSIWRDLHGTPTCSLRRRLRFGPLARGCLHVGHRSLHFCPRFDFHARKYTWYTLIWANVSFGTLLVFVWVMWSRC